jgi:hypothetical protein
LIAFIRVPAGNCPDGVIGHPIVLHEGLLQQHPVP